ncbi:MAG TPA: ATP-binding protein, partial [Pseudonocardia sp.]|nr:ATP-binding protein [Pseudonocardia sp.]
MWKAMLDPRRRGPAPEPAQWRPRHRLLLGVLAVHVLGLVALGVALGRPTGTLVVAVVVPVVALGVGALGMGRDAVAGRRAAAALAVAVGSAWSSAALVGLTGLGEGAAHLVLVLALVALYRWWPALLVAGLVAVVLDVVGALAPGVPLPLGPAAAAAPWTWVLVHAVAVAAVCAAVALVAWAGHHEPAARLAGTGPGRAPVVADLLVGLARRSQGTTHRQREVLDRLRGAEHDPDRLAELARLDHLTSRARRTAENLLVLAGEQPPRPAGDPVPLREIAQAVATGAEDPDRVRVEVGEGPGVTGRAAADVAHLLTELVENALRFSPPDTTVTVRSAHGDDGGRVLTVADRGVGMAAHALAEANTALADPPAVDLAVARRLGLPAVARLAGWHGITVALAAGEETGLVCTVALPAAVLTGVGEPQTAQFAAQRPAVDAAPEPATDDQPGTPAPQPAGQQELTSAPAAVSRRPAADDAAGRP